MPNLAPVARCLTELGDAVFGHGLAGDTKPGNFFPPNQFHDSGVADLGMVKIQVLQERHLGDVIQASVGDLCIRQIEPRESGQTGQVPQTGVARFGLLQTERKQIFHPFEINDACVGDLG